MLLGKTRQVFGGLVAGSVEAAQFVLLKNSVIKPNFRKSKVVVQAGFPSPFEKFSSSLVSLAAPPVTHCGTTYFFERK